MPADTAHDTAPNGTRATGPRTAGGKAVAARNATTHGLHAQAVVVPPLGEDPADYQALRDELAAELSPRTPTDHHYVQQAAQAMWRLRRLARWETGLYDDPALTDEERITKMARVLRHDAALRRHVDRALKALRDSPQGNKICQNEPAPAHPSSPGTGEVARLAATEGVPVPAPPELGAGGRSSPVSISALRKARQQKRHNCRNGPAPVPQLLASPGTGEDPPAGGNPGGGWFSVGIT